MGIIDQETGVRDITKSLLRHEGLRIGAVDGLKTIAQAADIFPGGINRHFADREFSFPSEPREEMMIDVRALLCDGLLRDIFGGINTELDLLCLTQAQIIECVNTYGDEFRFGERFTLFLFMAGRGFFVSLVHPTCPKNINLAINLDRLDFDKKKFKAKRCQVVVPMMAVVRPPSRDLMPATAEMPSYRP